MVCINVRARFVSFMYTAVLGTGEKLVVRSCSLDSGSTTADTEIVRISNCGAFQFEDQLVQILEY